MANMMKKTYVKPQLKTMKVELGVFGTYGGGDTTQPYLPIEDPRRLGGLNPSG